jgi:hypothetical protein
MLKNRITPATVMASRRRPDIVIRQRDVEILVDAKPATR